MSVYASHPASQPSGQHPSGKEDTFYVHIRWDKYLSFLYQTNNLEVCVFLLFFPPSTFRCQDFPDCVECWMLNVFFVNEMFSSKWAAIAVDGCISGMVVCLTFCNKVFLFSFWWNVLNCMSEIIQNLF